MPPTIPHQPRQYLGVMVSSTFKDLEKHRAALLDALRKEELFAIGMEDYVPVPGDDVISSSLNMVNKGAANIGLISHRCGQVLECPTRNPKSYAVTRLEFEEAMKLGLPTLIFVMSQEHEVKPAHVDRDAESIAKLNEFRTAAKSGRIYIDFDSLEDFTPKAIHAVASLRRYIEEHSKLSGSPVTDSPSTDPTVPHAPAFYAEPDYIGSHQFVGRQAELDALSDWANRSDPTNFLLFEAIGGNGKSMLTWKWTTKHAAAVRPDWAGRFWYSFYERGAIMQDFCQRALAYMTGRPLKEFEKRKTGEMKDEFIAQLHARPWLLILDGLERVLVAYHRIDAAEVPDEEANAPTDKILNRNPCDAIRDEDSDLLRSLAACAPSKILVSSRLTPRILLNPAGQPIPGAKRITLTGLRPPDAEALLCQCGITGNSATIQDYLTRNCDNHPLVIGILAGLIAHYLPDRGNFDAWSTDPSGGAALDLANLDLIQRRNHILNAAIAALPNASRQLLSTLALLPESVDYTTLEALNPHLPPEPKRVDEPPPLEDQPIWKVLSEENKVLWKMNHDKLVRRNNEYKRAVKLWHDSMEVREAPKKLTESVRDLEQRGLLQYDVSKKRHSLHAVVRGVTSGSMRIEDKRRYGQRVVDHFSSRPHIPYQQARSLDDLHSGLHVIRTLLKLGHFQQAIDLYKTDFPVALLTNLEAYVETLSLLKPFFQESWGLLPKTVTKTDAAILANNAGIALMSCGEYQASLVACAAAIAGELENKEWERANANITNTSILLFRQGRLAGGFRANALATDFATVRGDKKSLFTSWLALFEGQSCSAQATVNETWLLITSMERDWDRAAYRQGEAEESFARWQFRQGVLKEEHLEVAAALAEKYSNREVLRDLHRLRGSWRLEQHNYHQAATSFQEAVRMARERRLVDAESETGLALAKLHLVQITGDDARSETERLAQLRHPAHRTLAMLWLAIGDHMQAEHHALAAYKWAWADGEPYVNRYELTKTTELLQKMKIPVPELPPYDPAKDEPFPWEADVRAAIEKLKAEKVVKK